jgi:hypothetical protein
VVVEGGAPTPEDPALAAMEEGSSTRTSQSASANDSSTIKREVSHLMNGIGSLQIKVEGSLTVSGSTEERQLLECLNPTRVQQDPVSRVVAVAVIPAPPVEEVPDSPAMTNPGHIAQMVSTPLGQHLVAWHSVDERQLESPCISTQGPHHHLTSMCVVQQRTVQWVFNPKPAGVVPTADNDAAIMAMEEGTQAADGAAPPAPEVSNRIRAAPETHGVE